MKAAEHVFKMRRTVSGAPALEHLKAAAKAGNRRAQAALADQPFFPIGTEYLFEWWHQVRSRKGGNGWGPVPIEWPDLYAWSRLMRLDPTPWELEVIGAIDDAWLADRAEEADKRSSTSRPPEG